MKEINGTFFTKTNEDVIKLRQAIYKMQDENLSVYGVIKHDWQKGNTLTEIAKMFYGGDLDIDVYDADIDIAVAFVYTVTDKPQSPYEEFLKILADNVEVQRIDEEGITCYFSKYFASFGKKLTDFIGEVEWESGEFDPVDFYYDMTLKLESLVAGYATDSTYKLIVELLSNKDAE